MYYMYNTLYTCFIHLFYAVYFCTQIPFTLTNMIYSILYGTHLRVCMCFCSTIFSKSCRRLFFWVFKKARLYTIAVHTQDQSYIPILQYKYYYTLRWNVVLSLFYYYIPCGMYFANRIICFLLYVQYTYNSI